MTVRSSTSPNLTLTLRNSLADGAADNCDSWRGLTFDGLGHRANPQDTCGDLRQRHGKPFRDLELPGAGPQARVPAI